MEKCGLCVVVHTCNPRWEVETELSGIQGHPLICSESEASLAYMRPCLKNRDTHVLGGYLPSTMCDLEWCYHKPRISNNQQLDRV